MNNCIELENGAWITLSNLPTTTTTEKINNVTLFDDFSSHRWLFIFYNQFTNNLKNSQYNTLMEEIKCGYYDRKVSVVFVNVDTNAIEVYYTDNGEPSIVNTSLYSVSDGEILK